MIELRTERLTLRPLRADDVPALFAVFSDPKVMRYWSTPPWQGIESAHKMLAGDAVALAEGEAMRWGLERSSDSQLLGACSLLKMDNACERAEIGYALASAAWGQGYMNEALRAVVAHAFTGLHLHRIEADVDPRNVASVKSLERLGFRREGLLRERWLVAGERSDSALYGFLASDFRRDSAQAAPAATDARFASNALPERDTGFLPSTPEM